jgi:histidine triad (HIT) family protein
MTGPSQDGTCMVCQAIQGGSGLVVYEDDDVVAMLDENPASAGHLAVMPKEHYAILENVPDYLVNSIFQAANRLSVAVFESLKIQGTNILVSNGGAAGQALPHFMVNIIPRTEGDGMNFQWVPKQLSEEEMSTVEIVLKEQAAAVGAFETKKKDETIVMGEPAEINEEEKGEKGRGAGETPPEGENYLLKHLRRIA